LRATLEDIAGSISGTVTYASATPDLEEERARIEAVLDQTTSEVPVEEMETVDAAAIAREDGTYTVYFLSPGTYDVTATATIDAVEYTDGPTTVPVAVSEDVVGVDFSL
jgi:3-dehydroquinate dehydratase